MDEAYELTERAVTAGAVIETEPCFELTGEAIRYLATHQLSNAPDDSEAVR